MLTACYTQIGPTRSYYINSIFSTCAQCAHAINAAHQPHIVVAKTTARALNDN